VSAYFVAAAHRLAPGSSRRARVWIMSGAMSRHEGGGVSRPAACCMGGIRLLWSACPGGSSSASFHGDKSMLEPAIENHVRLAVQEELRGLQEALNSEMRGAFARITKASTTSGGGDSYQPGGLGRTNLHAKSSRSFDAGAASGKSHLYQRRNTVTGVATDSVFDAWRGMSASIPPPPPASGGGVVATVSSEALNSVQDAADEQGVQAQESEPRSSGGESTPDSGDARAMEAEKSGRSTPSMASTSWRVDALDLGIASQRLHRPAKAPPQ